MAKCSQLASLPFKGLMSQLAMIVLMIDRNAVHGRQLSALDHHPHCDPGKYEQRDEEQQTVKDIPKVTPFLGRLCFHVILLLASSYLHHHRHAQHFIIKFIITVVCFSHKAKTIIRR